MEKFFLYIIPNQNSTAKYLKITTVASEWQRVKHSHQELGILLSNIITFKNMLQTKKSIFQIETKDQLADIFTKPLDRVIFKKLRLLLMGW